MDKQASTLTSNGVAEICLPKEDYNYDGQTSWFLQIVEIKDFSTDKTKKNIKMRLKLSDGVSTMVTIVNDAIYQKMLQV